MFSTPVAQSITILATSRTMTKFKIEHRVRHIVSQVLQKLPITLKKNVSLYGNGADSLDVFNILFLIEYEFSIKFDKKDTEEFGRKTINEITDIVKGLTKK